MTYSKALSGRRLAHHQSTILPWCHQFLCLISAAMIIVRINIFTIDVVLIAVAAFFGLIQHSRKVLYFP
jgi:hypothetical protein